MENLVRVSKANNLPFKPQTFYKWWHMKKYPEIFVKFSGALFVDLDALKKIMEAGRKRGEH
jgi:hypothetical protein